MPTPSLDALPKGHELPPFAFELSPLALYASTSNTTLRPSTSFTFPFTVTSMPMGVGAMCLTQNTGSPTNGY